MIYRTAAFLGPITTPDQYFKVTWSFDADHLRNG